MERWVQKASLAGLALAVIVGPAFAASAFAQSFAYNGGTTNPINYATQAVVSNSTALTAAAASATSGIFAAVTLNPISSTVTFTLPSGLLFAAPPGANCTLSTPADGSCALGTPTGGMGANSVTIPFTYNITTAGTTITVQLTAGFSFNNAGILSTPQSTPLIISMASNDANFRSSANAQFAESQSALAFSTQGPALGIPFIDVGASGLGAKFTQNGPDTLTAGDGAVQLQTNNVVDATNSPFTFVNGATITISGQFGGIGSAFLTQPGSTSCTGSPYLPGTVTGSSITLPGVYAAAGKGAQELCLVASGNTVIASNLASPTAVAVIPATATTAATTQTPSNSALSSYTYNGMVQQLLVSGDLRGGGYDYTVRVANNTSAPVPLIALVQADSGPSGSAVFQPLPGGENEFLDASGIVSAAGVAPGQPVSILMLAPGAACVNGVTGSTCPLTISGLLTNPNGDITQVGSGAAP